MRLCITFLIVAMLGGCAQSDLHMPLQFASGELDRGEQEFFAHDRSLRWYVAPVQDLHPQAPAIGAIHYPKKTASVYSTTLDAGAFVSELVTDELESLGFNLVTDEAAADRVLHVQLTEFFAEERKNYLSRVEAEVSVTASDGVQLWRKVVGGTGSTGGLRHSFGNFNECLSDATLKLIGQVLNNPGFQKVAGVEEPE